MNSYKVCILGGTGFVGQHLITSLAEAGHQVKVACRRPHRFRDLAIGSGVTLAEITELTPQTLNELFAGQDAVINLIGILNEYPRRGITFRQLHIDLVKQIVDACHSSNIQHYLHMSAINASAAHGSSAYLRSKGEGEAKAFVGRAHMTVTAFRPSVIFGPGDSFFNRFAGVMKLTPLVFPLACPNARFAPVYVGDVAAAFIGALQSPELAGKSYDLCGPRQFTLKELVQYTGQVSGHRRWVISLPDVLARLQGQILQYAPGKPFTPDNYASLQTDAVCAQDGCAELGITPSDVDTIVPQYLGIDGKKSRYSGLRSQAGRDQ